VPFRSFLLIAAVILAAACAHSGNKVLQQGSSCELSARDSVFTGLRPVFRDCAVQRAAHLVSNTSHPNFRPTAVRNACFFADLEFVVDSAGRPETGTARVVRANDDKFGEAVLATLPEWRYDPALRDGKPVRQIVDVHQTMGVMVAVVPAGTPPPTRPPTSQRQPSC
jgi:hypothetical protein